MKQKRIMELLLEASHPSCSEKRIDRIGYGLAAAVRCKKATEHFTAGDIRMCERVVGMVFNLTHLAGEKDQRHCLPGLFPLFAKLCGDNRESFSSMDGTIGLTPFPNYIDWRLMEKELLRTENFE